LISCFCAPEIECRAELIKGVKNEFAYENIVDAFDVDVFGLVNVE
jgi:hypothetical protein